MFASLLTRDHVEVENLAKRHAGSARAAQMVMLARSSSAVGVISTKHAVTDSVLKDSVPKHSAPAEKHRKRALGPSLSSSDSFPSSESELPVGKRARSHSAVPYLLPDRKEGATSEEKKSDLQVEHDLLQAQWFLLDKDIRERLEPTKQSQAATDEGRVVAQLVAAAKRQAVEVAETTLVGRPRFLVVTKGDARTGMTDPKAGRAELTDPRAKALVVRPRRRLRRAQNDRKGSVNGKGPRLMPHLSKEKVSAALVEQLGWAPTTLTAVDNVPAAEACARKRPRLAGFLKLWRLSHVRSVLGWQQFFSHVVAEVELTRRQPAPVRRKVMAKQRQAKQKRQANQNADSKSEAKAEATVVGEAVVGEAVVGEAVLGEAVLGDGCIKKTERMILTWGDALRLAQPQTTWPIRGHVSLATFDAIIRDCLPPLHEVAICLTPKLP